MSFDFFYVYFPIADVTLNVFAIVFIGLLTGCVSGLFGVGGGFIVVPFLSFFGVPTSVAIATSVNQMTAGSLSSVLTYSRMKRVDYVLSAALIFGGLLGIFIGHFIILYLQSTGYFELVITLSFVILLTIISTSSAIDAFKIIKNKQPVERQLGKFAKIMLALPMQMTSNSYQTKISVIPIAILGMIGGVFVITLGVGGGFLMIPALLYVFHLQEKLVAGTVQAQMFITSIISTFLHSLEFDSIDILLSAFLITGTVIGARLGAIMGSKMDANRYRLLLAGMFVIICFSMFKSLLTEPKEKYQVYEVMR